VNILHSLKMIRELLPTFCVCGIGFVQHRKMPLFF
jgi:hypothetical protein